MKKRIFDVVCAGGLIITFLPLFILIGLWVAVDSPGPVIFKQERLGIKGRKFVIFKFRSMFVEANSEKVRESTDPRITPSGRFLRRTHLDELPQLWNVLLGQMSLVGPRPFTEDDAKLFRNDDGRWLVKPGITGLSQLKGRFRSCYFLDRIYLRYRCLSFDIWILLKTLGVILRGGGGI